jgi:hypothetical protein
MRIRVLLRYAGGLFALVASRARQKPRCSNLVGSRVSDLRRDSADAY